MNVNICYQSEIDFDYFIEQSRFEDNLIQLAHNILSTEFKDNEVNIIFCDNEYIQQLNKEFRDKDKPTDVLTFTIDDEDVIGEIYISIDFILQNEKMKNKTYYHEVAFMVIHGSLHLLGYTHDDKDDTKKMREEEDKFFNLFSRMMVSSSSKFIYKKKNRNIIDSLLCAGRGVFYVIRTQRNMKIHLTMAGIVLGLGAVLELSKFEWISIMFAMFLVMVAEIMNTAIEVNVDLVTRKLRPRAMVAKDTAAGAVFIASLGAVVIGLLVFVEKIILFFQS